MTSVRILKARSSIDAEPIHPGNGSDVFGSDICTCKPYLTYAIEECVRGAQRGGVGLVVYFRKEGRALGEVTKYASSMSLSVVPLMSGNI